MKWYSTSVVYGIALLIFWACASCKRLDSQANSLPQPKAEQLVWGDEFNKNGIPDTSKWIFQTGDGCPRICGWGNNELQYYTDSQAGNAIVENGHLIIEATNESTGNSKYSSAKLVTKGKADWTYGTVEVRAKLPTGTGTWPAIWMMPVENNYGGWPRSGEIDIMEHVGYRPDSVFGTVHTEAFNHIVGTQDGGAIKRPAIAADFHVFKMEWNADAIHWYMDGERYHTFENRHKSYKEWPFDKPFYLILNLAVGGDWGGKHGVDDSIWPQSMVVDYVRVYQ